MSDSVGAIKVNNPECKYGFNIYPKHTVVKAMIWSLNSTLDKYESFLAYYIEHKGYKFEYTTGLGWILKWPASYRTLYDGDYIISGYRDPIILNAVEFYKQYNIIEDNCNC